MLHLKKISVKKAEPLTRASQLQKALTRIKNHFAGETGNNRLESYLFSSLSWTLSWSITLMGVVALDGLFLVALLATPGDWELVAKGLHALSGEALNSLFHHAVIPYSLMAFVRLWMLRTLWLVLKIARDEANDSKLDETSS